MSAKCHRRVTVAYAAIAAGIVTLVMAYFISHEVNKGVEANQAKIEAAQVRSTQELIDSCIRGGIARNDRYAYSINEEAFAIYMAGQENDPEIRQGWVHKAAYEKQRQKNVIAEAERIGFVLPGSVFVDCEKVVSSP